ncbi:MAG: ImmA/IrrE family metallo-endopeptidase [Actinobacteria bacterium]|nr:ImmA/IrrE family metallo-endopeptidase [Actinomycetota bacterium]
MAVRIEALANPELLIWARKAAGFNLDTAAKRVQVSVARLADWESGERRPTFNQLRKLAHIYRRPIAVFYLQEAPSDPAYPRDFRRLPGEVSGMPSPELRWEIRRAEYRRKFALELLAEQAETPRILELTVDFDTNPEDVSIQIRGLLGLEMQAQFTWKDPHESFAHWRGSIEAAGFLCLQMTDVSLTQARGFSLAEFPLPTLVVNIKDSPRGRSFSLLHELTHVLLRQGGVCDLDDTSGRRPEELRVERYCNAVAGATLVPAEYLLTHPVVVAHGGRSDWNDDELESLTRSFAASREAVLRRLLDLGRTTTDFYTTRRQGFLEEYETARLRKTPGFAPPHLLALASAGPTLTGLALSSYSEGDITASDVSDLLGVRVKHLERIQEQLVRGERSR